MQHLGVNFGGLNLASSLGVACPVSALCILANLTSHLFISYFLHQYW